MLQVIGALHSHPFSIATNASNKGYRKIYSLMVQDFDAKTGTLHRKLLDFIEDHKEDAESIANNIKSVLERNGLNVKDITSYCADNAPVNFGRHNSVFTKLRADNQNTVLSRCYAHIIHNTTKKFCDVPPIDAENIVTKVYGHFSIMRIEAQCFDGVRWVW